MLPEVESDEVSEAAHRVRQACRRIRFYKADVVVVVSPHAPASGVYQSNAGSLDGFGITGIATQAREDVEATKELAEHSTLDLLHDRADHGIVVACRLLECDAPVVAVGFSETDSLDSTRATAAHVAQALGHLSEDRLVAVVASANGSAGLSPRAPLTELRGARQAEDRLHDAVETDLGWLASLAPELRSSAGSCAQGPLEVLGQIFSGRRGRVLAHEAPVGVGYMVAVIDGD